MMYIHLIVVGKYKEHYWRQAEAEYLKRLSPYAKISIREIPEESFRPTDNFQKIQKKEAEKIKKHIPDGSAVILLHEQGKQYDSKQFAKTLQTMTAAGQHLTFILGGPTGLAKTFLDTADLKLSLSPLTFPHQLARVILLEQLYRANTIIQSKTYHY